jgi:hypothetical protein
MNGELGSLNLVSWFSQRATFSIRSSSTANIKMENAMQAILKTLVAQEM